MWIDKREITKLSADLRKIIDGQDIDLRDNREGAWSLLKNDIYTLARQKNEQVDVLESERDAMADTLADISHQLKTPLTSMRIMTDLLENALVTDVSPPEKEVEFLANIKIGLARMEWLTLVLLKMAKLDAGAVEFAREDIQAETLVSLALEPLQILLDVKGQSVEIACNTALRCDKRWTAEALTNVLKNASEYSPEGGKIWVKSGTTPICSWLSVTDSGEGIPHQEIAGLFKRFSRSRSDGGYGIGLPLALTIMRGQNGDIEVDGGGGGVGATFVMKFY